MKISMSKTLSFLLLILLLLTYRYMNFSRACAEETLYCTVSLLNGRAEPSKNAHVEAQFERGTELTVVGYSGEWVEVIGGETGTVFVCARYVAASLEDVKYQNASGGRVFIREAPGGKKTNQCVKANKIITVCASSNGWGYIDGCGWVDLSYFNEVAE